jgi:hypothetical protein
MRSYLPLAALAVVLTSGCNSAIKNDALRSDTPLNCAELELQDDHTMREYGNISELCIKAIIKSSDCHLNQQFIGILFHTCSTEEKYAHLYCEAQKVIGEADGLLWKWNAVLRRSQNCE